jgi:hypothetical protein
MNRSTNLQLDAYDSLWDATPFRKQKRRPTYTYKIPQKQVWSIVPKFPHNSHASSGSKWYIILPILIIQK